MLNENADNESPMVAQFDAELAVPPLTTRAWTVSAVEPVIPLPVTI
jgi:hypothetical protein